MDELVKKLAGFGIPAIILLVAMSATGLAGAAALTSALAALGPFGMIGGMALLLFIGLSADKLTEFGYEKITNLVIQEQLKKYSKEEMISKIKKYPISKGMKLKVIDFVNRV
ncbi:hypothetical protein [Vagococcus fluvialis]|uniref:hypothetical protein n=1 Tax=Vagococcus fluvialis TaxID=2738 RepID=UPI00379D20E2